MALYSWSQTAASNATADASINWAEGQAPSSVNDSARAMMAATAKWRDDISGSLLTGGSGSAYTLTTNSVFGTLPNLAWQLVAFIAHATNTNTVGNDATLSIDGLAAKPIRMQPSVSLPTGSIIIGTTYFVSYNNSDAVFYLQNMLNPYAIPLGGIIDFAGTVSPNSALALPFGQEVSRTTYATLFALTSTTYGVGDNSTTFNLPDFRGRVGAGRDSMGGTPANRLTATYFGASSGLSGSTLGATGGGESITLATSNLPAYTPAGTITNGAITSTVSGGVNGGSGSASFPGGAGTNLPAPTTTISVTSTQTASSFAGTAQGGTSTAFPRVPPTLIINKLIRVI